MKDIHRWSEYDSNNFISVGHGSYRISGVDLSERHGDYGICSGSIIISSGAAVKHVSVTEGKGKYPGAGSCCGEESGC